MKIIIVDDHPLMRIGIRNVLIESNLNAEIIGEVAGAAALLNLLSKKTPDIILLDIELSDRNGIDILHDLKKMYPQIPTLVLSMHLEEHFALRAFKAGASGYLNKKAYRTELIKAIRKIVQENKLYINAEVAEELARQLTDDPEILPHQQLSDREYEVLSLIANGKKVSEIADMLSLSVQTIHSYRRRIKGKMNLDSNAEIIRYALEHELVI
ncbi:MAG TPA: response regulator transcription factor [Balneolaceae bacterium]|nr:response regulator transcription factor [Balneolaceae bacterium]